MSLINREDLMLTLGITDMDCEKCGWYNKATEQCKRGSDFKDACCAIEDAPEVQPEPKWIPVSERLPEKSGLYYVSGGDNVWICEFLIISNFTGGWCNNVANPVVQAWMPLPEPYLEEGE